MGAGRDPRVPSNAEDNPKPIYDAPTIARTHPKKRKKPIPYQEREFKNIMLLRVKWIF